MNAPKFDPPDIFEGSNVLVTGADGFIGSHLVEALVARKANVTAMCMYNSFDTRGWIDDLAPAIREQVNAVRGDVRDQAFMRAVIRQQDIVFHLAALIAIPYSYVAAQSYVDTNVIGTLNVLEAARDSSVRRVIITSTSEVYGSAITVPITEHHPLQGQSPYSASKIGADMLAEAFARSHDLPAVILRPFNTFGPRQSERAVIPAVLRQALDPRVREVRVGDLAPIRDFTFVKDTAQAFLAIGSSDKIAYGQPYNAGTGRAVSMHEVVAMICSITECSKPVRQDAHRLRPAKSEVRELLADPTLLAEATGWQAQTSLKEGLELTVSWWRRRLEKGYVRSEMSYAT